MNLEEATAIVAKVNGYVPYQMANRLTPQAFAEALDDITFEEALEAVRLLGRRELEPQQTLYISTSNIRWQVKRIREDRARRAKVAERMAIEPVERPVLMGTEIPKGKRWRELRDAMAAAKSVDDDA